MLTVGYVPRIFLKKHIIIKYLINLVCLIHTVSNRLHFFFMARMLHTWAIRMEKKNGSVTYSMDVVIG